MRLAAILGAGLALLPAPTLAQTVTIGTAKTYDAGPFTVDPAALQGFEKALAQTFCERAALDCRWKAMARSDLMPALERHEVDVAMAAIPSNAALGQGIAATAAYLYPDPFDFVGAPGTQMHANVGTVATVSDPEVRAWSTSTGYTFRYFATLGDALKFYRRGEAQAILAERAALQPVIGASGGRLAVIVPRDRLRRGVTMALRSEDADLRFDIEDRIYDMVQDGSLNALTRSWFGVDASAW